MGGGQRRTAGGNESLHPNWPFPVARAIPGCSTDEADWLRVFGGKKETSAQWIEDKVAGRGEKYGKIWKKVTKRFAIWKYQETCVIWMTFQQTNSNKFKRWSLSEWASLQKQKTQTWIWDVHILGALKMFKLAVDGEKKKEKTLLLHLEKFKMSSTKGVALKRKNCTQARQY